MVTAISRIWRELQEFIAKGDYSGAIAFVALVLFVVVLGLSLGNAAHTSIANLGRFIKRRVIDRYFPENPQPCPFCGEGPIRPGAIVCRFCSRDLPYCPFCREGPIKPDALVCRFCSHEITRICPRCSKPVPREALTCPHCSQQFLRPPAHTASE